VFTFSDPPTWANLLSAVQACNEQPTLRRLIRARENVTRPLQLAGLFWGLCGGLNVVAGVILLDLDAQGALLIRAWRGTHTVLWASWAAGLACILLSLAGLHLAEAHLRRRVRIKLVQERASSLSSKGVLLSYAEGVTTPGDETPAGVSLHAAPTDVGPETSQPWHAFLLYRDPDWVPTSRAEQQEGINVTWIGSGRAQAGAWGGQLWSWWLPTFGLGADASRREGPFASGSTTVGPGGMRKVRHPPPDREEEEASSARPMSAHTDSGHRAVAFTHGHEHRSV